MGELDHKESWPPKNWCFWTLVLEKTLESPLDSKEIKAVHPKGNQSWIFIGRTDGEAETPILWSPDVKSWLIWKDLNDGKTEGRREGDDREWDGWMASPTRWTWVWASSRRWWITGEPGVMQSLGSQRVRQDLTTEQQQQRRSDLTKHLLLPHWLCVDHNKLWKILKKMGIPDHLSCLLKNLYAGQEATVRTGHGTKTDSKWGKEYVKEVDLLI